MTPDVVSVASSTPPVRPPGEEVASTDRTQPTGRTSRQDGQLRQVLLTLGYAFVSALSLFGLFGYATEGRFDRALLFSVTGFSMGLAALVRGQFVKPVANPRRR